jgi:hypothetical protein
MYQVNTIGMKGLSQNDVLLDDQANVSNIHPSLLHSIQPAGVEIRVNVIGGVQLTADSTGYLQDFPYVRKCRYQG